MPHLQQTNQREQKPLTSEIPERSVPRRDGGHFRAPIQAVKTLDNILPRMQSHQEKKRSMLRMLRLATGFLRHGSIAASPPEPERSGAGFPPRPRRTADEGIHR